MIEKLRQQHPKIYKHFFTVTTFSKLVALSLFIILPFVGFYLGMKYQQLVTAANTPIVSEVQKTVVSTTAFVPNPTITELFVGWKTYNGIVKDVSGVTVKYSFMYPASWIENVQNGYTRLIPQEQKEDPQVVFWVTPPERDLPGFKEIRVFPAGKAKYLWYSNVAYGWAYFDKKGFEFSAPKNESEKYEKLFDQILSTVSFTQ